MSTLIFTIKKVLSILPGAISILLKVLILGITPKVLMTVEKDKECK